MTPPVRSRTSRTGPGLRPEGRDPAAELRTARRAPETPQPRQPWSAPATPPIVDSSDPSATMSLALEHALSITTALSEEELGSRTVEAAGRLTAATIAGAVLDGGITHTWGDEVLAARLVSTLAVTELGPLEPYDVIGPDRVAFDQVGLPDALLTRARGALLVVASSEPDRFGPPQQRLLALLMAHAIAGRERLRELALLARRADCDPLTGLRHHRPFEERLAASVPGRTAVIAIDIDNFKQINDVHGHQAGDTALVTLVRALSRALRGDDHIYRIGGDEFAVVIDVATAAEVTAISRRLLRAARSAGYPISVGAALRSPHETGREALLRADRALYQAKRAGRNTARLAA